MSEIRKILDLLLKDSASDLFDNLDKANSSQLEQIISGQELLISLGELSFKEVEEGDAEFQKHLETAKQIKAKAEELLKKKSN